MKNKLHILIILILLSFSTIYAQNRFGMGIILGEPTGLSAKLWTGSINAIDFGAAWSFKDDGHLLLQGDYVWHSYVDQTSTGKAAFYYGIGGRIIFSDDPLIGARVPLGLDYRFNEAPIDIFAEIVPILDLAPSTNFNLGGGIGVRFWFN